MTSRLRFASLCVFAFVVGCNSDVERDLLEASSVGNLERIQQLLRSGANPNAKSWDDGATPLILAARYERLDVAKLLIASGADPKISDSAGTPLFWACFSGSGAVANYLNGIGAPLAASDASLAKLQGEKEKLRIPGCKRGVIRTS
jgi:ankyrin repeat protein